MSKTEKIKIQPGSIRGSFVPKSFNAERNTIDVIWSTGAKVMRQTWFGDKYYEELSMKKAHVDLGRFQSGSTSVLNNHGTSEFGGVRDLNDVLGVLESADINKNGEGIGTVRFSKRADIQGIIEDIKDGIIRNLSVGYNVRRYEEQAAPDGEPPTYRAVDWEPMELSFVAIPADPSAQVRSAPQGNGQEVILQRKEEEIPAMTVRAKKKVAEAPVEPVEDKTPAAEHDGDAAPVDAKGDLDQVDDQPKSDEAQAPSAGDAIQAKEEQDKDVPAADASGDSASATPGGVHRSAPTTEQTRQAEIVRGNEIRAMVRTMKLEESFADKLVSNASIDANEARKQIFAEIQKRNDQNPTINQRIEVKDMDQRQARRAAATRGLLNRFDEKLYPLKQDGDQEFRQNSLIDTCRHFLALEGVKDAYTMSRTDVATRGLQTTSDFGNVLADTANKTLRQGYESAPNTYLPFTAKKTVKDFKTISSIEVSNGGRLEKVNEHGEYRRTSLVEGVEKYKMDKFGLVIGRTWELMINDDMDAFTDLPTKLGRRAREKENEIFWGLILANPLMADGKAFFHADHGNLASVAAAIAAGPIGIGRGQMRVQKDLDGELIGGLSPKHLVLPAALETVGEQFLSPIVPGLTANVNPFYNKLDLMVEPRLDAGSATAWYLFADKAVRATAEMATLEGHTGPEIFTREGWNVDGMEVKVRYVFGMKLIDYRAAFKNAGV